MPNVEEAAVKTPTVGQFVVTWDSQTGAYNIQFTTPVMATVGQFVDLLDEIKRKAIETDGFRS